MDERTILVFSDVEMGPGGPHDDFPHDDWFAGILERLSAPYPRDEPVDLVFNGDTLDFLRVEYDGGFPIHVTSTIARAKLERIAGAHGVFFDAVRRFLEGGDRSVHFVVGNHDPELLFPEVQTRIAALCGHSEGVRFPGFELELGPIHFEHGSQEDPMFAMPADRPFVSNRGESILNLPWGSLAVLDGWLSLREELGALDRIKPRTRLFELLPEARALVLKRSWHYFANEYWRGYRDGDPLKRISWAMLKELTYRFVTGDADVRVRKRYLERLKNSSAIAFVLSHEHQASRALHDGKTLLTTGFLRDEYRIRPDGDTLRPARRGGAIIRLSGDRLVRRELVEFAPPTALPGRTPTSLRSLLPLIRRELAALDAA